MEQAGGGDPQPPGLLAQPRGQARLKAPPGLLDSSPITPHLQVAKGRGGFVHRSQQLLEEGGVGLGRQAQTSLGDVVPVGQRRRQRLESIALVGRDLLEQHLQGGVVCHQVVLAEQQQPAALRLVLGDGGVEQGRQAQIQPVTAWSKALQ